MRRIFVDCGFHRGQGLEELSGKLRIGTDWEIYCFEPNPENWKYLDAAHNDYGVHRRHEAVWTEFGSLEFWQENNAGNPDGWGSSMMPHFGYKRGEKQLGAPELFESPITVPTVNFAEWLRLLASGNEDCEIHIKMDIEGAEFAVLRHMLAFEHTPWNKIESMYIEFHQRFVDGESPESEAQLMKELVEETKIVMHW